MNSVKVVLHVDGRPSVNYGPFKEMGRDRHYCPRKFFNMIILQRVEVDGREQRLGFEQSSGSEKEKENLVVKVYEETEKRSIQSDTFWFGILKGVWSFKKLTVINIITVKTRVSLFVNSTRCQTQRGKVNWICRLPYGSGFHKITCKNKGRKVTIR